MAHRLAFEHEVASRAFVKSMNKDTPEFGAATKFVGDQATITLRGTADSVAAIELGRVLNTAIDRRPASIVLDVTELDELSPAGLLAVSNAERRLATMGVAKITLRSASVLANELIGVMDSAKSSPPALPEDNHLGPEELSGTSVLTERLASSLAVEDLRRVTAMPTGPDVIDGALRLIVELARISIGVADGVSVSLLRNGVLSTVAASDQTILAMDADQYSTGQGPCVDASVKGHWFHAESLDNEKRWPAFTPQARSLGIRAILSSPLRAFDKPIGALNIYSRTAESFEKIDQESAAGFAQQASVILSDAHADVSDTQMAIRFEEALRSRKVISLAQGIIMERDGIDEITSFSALLRLALHQGVPLRERAEAMVLSAKQPELGPEWGLDD